MLGWRRMGSQQVWTAGLDSFVRVLIIVSALERTPPIMTIALLGAHSEYSGNDDDGPVRMASTIILGQ